MNRIIKFRVWDKDAKYFIDAYSWSFGFSAFEYFTGVDNGIDKKFVFQQFTGLKDKNGVEIYEGDIIKINDILWTVWWFELGYFELIRSLEKQGQRESQLLATAMSGEIIGNIHENPKLLNP